MPINTQWDDEAKTIILCTANGEPSEAEIEKCQGELNALFNSVNYPVGVIINSSNNMRMPGRLKLQLASVIVMVVEDDQVYELLAPTKALSKKLSEISGKPEQYLFARNIFLARGMVAKHIRQYNKSGSH